jgi:hypothetical protein
MVNGSVSSMSFFCGHLDLTPFSEKDAPNLFGDDRSCPANELRSSGMI